MIFESFVCGRKIELIAITTSICLFSHALVGSRLHGESLALYLGVSDKWDWTYGLTDFVLCILLVVALSFGISSRVRLVAGAVIFAAGGVVLKMGYLDGFGHFFGGSYSIARWHLLVFLCFSILAFLRLIDRKHLSMESTVICVSQYVVLGILYWVVMLLSVYDVLLCPDSSDTKYYLYDVAPFLGRLGLLVIVLTCCFCLLGWFHRKHPSVANQEQAAGNC